jgi:hypothetical protein
VIKTTKICRVCLQEKLISAFGIAHTTRGKVYLRTECKTCDTKRKKEYYKLHPEQLYAKNVITHLIEQNRLIRPNTCFDCNKQCKPQAHHECYDKPKEIIWLCASCHRKRHIKKEKRQ